MIVPLKILIEYRCYLVNPRAHFPYFSLVSSENSDPSHIHHGLTKVLEERGLPVGRVVAEDVGACLAIVEKRSIGLEESSSLGDEAEVVDVEGLEASGVHLDERGLVPGLALQLQPVDVLRV